MDQTLQLKGRVDRMDLKMIQVYVTYKRHTLDSKTQTGRERMGKDTLCKQKPKESWNKHSKQSKYTFFKTKIITKDKMEFYNDKRVHPTRYKGHKHIWT